LSCSVASFAPSRIASNLAHVILGSTVAIPAAVPNPQSVPAISAVQPYA
jgi:hypothetical protein